MPNEPRNTTGKRTLRQQMQAAAQATAQQKAQRDEDAARRAARKEERKRQSTTKRTASKRQAEKAKEEEKAKRKQDKESKGSVLSRIAEFFGNLGLPARIAIIVLVLVIAIGAILYPIGCTYYQAIRQEQKLQAELDAVNERNDAIDADNSALETDEGVESQARKEYGWVKDDENATIVTNADDSDDTSNELPSQVSSEEIEAPHTWYYDILDVIFQADV